MIDPKQIYTAHFTDNEQTTIEVLLGTEQPGVFESMIIPYNPTCLLYTSPSPRDVEESRMPSSA